MIRLSLFLCALAGLSTAEATTLSRVSFEDLVQKSTGIVRGRIVGSYSDVRGSLIYTYYKVQVEDRWKGAAAAQVEVQIPGGTFGGQQQNYLGTPQLTEGAEYVFFLWTGPSGANHLLGLSQGILDVTRDGNGEVVLQGQATDALVMDSAGRNTAAEPLRMKLSDFGTRVSGALKAGAKAK
ncbi:MAG TPA: hypothetical protein VL285_25850 [Bryobacteraceae bacterium]|nr:hypothetical protein [Bryobacteraceae bacterium]